MRVLLGFLNTSDYKEVETQNPLKPIPSVLDLGDLKSMSRAGPAESLQRKVHLKKRTPASAKGFSLDDADVPTRTSTKDATSSRIDKPRRRQTSLRIAVRYDIEVLTKVGVYSGIGILATSVNSTACVLLVMCVDRTR